MIAANHDTLWRRLAAAMGRPELAEDPRYATHGARGEHQDELDELIGAWAGARTAAELDELLGREGVVCAPVNNAADILADPHFRERGLIVEIQDEHHGPMPVPGVVPQLSGTPGEIRRAAPFDGRRRHARGAAGARPRRAADRVAARAGRDRHTGVGEAGKRPAR